MYQNTRQIVHFCTIIEKGAITTIGRSTIFEPRIQFGGGSISWYDDLKLKRNKEEAMKTKV